MSKKEIRACELGENVFEMIGKDWLLVTAESEGVCNTMTASWGGLGVMWGKDVAYIVLRPQRYTKEIVDQSGRFTLTVLNDTADRQKTYGYLGKVSGRNEDKIAGCGLTLVHDEATNAPYFEEAKTILICKTLFKQPFDPAAFQDSSLAEKWYPQKDYHTMYIAEIEKVLVAE